MTNALRHARAAPALAMSYISIVLTITYGYFLFEEVITPPPTFWWNSHRGYLHQGFRVYQNLVLCLVPLLLCQSRVSLQIHA